MIFVVNLIAVLRNASNIDNAVVEQKDVDVTNLIVPALPKNKRKGKRKKRKYLFNALLYPELLGLILTPLLIAMEVLRLP